MARKHGTELVEGPLQGGGGRHPVGDADDAGVVAVAQDEAPQTGGDDALAQLVGQLLEPRIRFGGQFCGPARSSAAVGSSRPSIRMALSRQMASTSGWVKCAICAPSSSLECGQVESEWG